jgi:hypothetical protein
VDFEAVARDDQLLDLLGRGARPGGNDAVIHALYAWRSDLAAGVDDVTPLNGAAPVNGVGPAKANGAAPAIGVARVNGTRPLNGVRPVNGRVNGVQPVNGSPRINGTKPGTGPEARDGHTDDVRRWGRRRAAVAAVVVGLSAGLGGVAVAAADARPGSPLWPITKVIYSDTAADRQASADAEAALDKARRALAQGRMSDAERYLDEASRRAAAADPEDADDLRQEMDAVRAQLDERKTTTGSDGAAPTPSPSSGEGDAPVSPPALPTPDADSGKDGSGSRGGKDQPDDNRDGHRDDGNTHTDAESTELSVPDYTIVTKQLPEF